MPTSIRRLVAVVSAVLLAVVLPTTMSAPAHAAPVRYEAEDATILNGLVESNHVGFTGSGFVNTANALGAGIELVVEVAAAGSRQLVVRYANGTTTDRPGRLTINGGSASTLAFPPSGAWTTWRTQAVTASLPAGTHRVRLVATSAVGLGNIDSLTDDDGTGGLVPVPDPLVDPTQSALGVRLTQFAQFPQSTPVPTPTDPRLMRHARVNFLGQIPGSTRRYVPDLNGRLYTLPATGGSPSVYLDVRASVGSNFFSGSGMGSGFGFVAFDRNFATNGRFYTTHTEGFGALTTTTPDWTQPNAVVHSVLTEWTATDPTAATFSGTRRTLLRIGFASYLHAIQQIDFNPTATAGSPDVGLLYVAVGDGGIGGSTTIPQQRNLPHGKVLRIDPRGTNGRGGRYGIPPSNPFVGQAGTLGEIYALGMRDPHRFSWDTGGTHRMFLGHIGEHAIEAIYDLRAGDNLGWSEREGAFIFDRDNRCTLFSLQSDDATYGFTYPVAATTTRWAPGATAMPAEPSPAGSCTGAPPCPRCAGSTSSATSSKGGSSTSTRRTWFEVARPRTVYRMRIFGVTGGETTMQALAGDSRVDLRFGTDATGELYLMAKANGRIWKVTGIQRTS